MTLYQSATAFDAVIVDLDGTMVDTMGDFVAALNLMLAELPAIDSGAIVKPQITHAVVERIVGKGSEHLIKSVLNELLAQSKPAPNAINSIAFDPGLLFNTAFASYQRHYNIINGQHSQVYPGVLEGLQGFQGAGLKLACLTNKPLAFAQSLLRVKGLNAFFAEVFGGDSFERKKPDPLPILKTCEALGTRPDRTLVIGDSSNDAEAARAAGCPVVMVTYGYNHGEPVRSVDADGFVDSLAELQWQM